MASIFTGSARGLTEGVAEEIALNHSKHLKPVFFGVGYGALGSQMAKLDFELVTPAQLQGFELVGGRYCSIRGKIAAQIKLTDEAGREHTLYVVSARGELLNVQEREQVFGDVVVTTWREGDLLFGLAR